MSKFCQNCGKPIDEGAKFCASCGTAVSEPAPAEAAPSGITPGFSARANDPELLAAVKKNRKLSSAIGMFIIPIPFIGFTIYGMVSENMEPTQGMLYGAVVSAVFLLFSLYGKLKSRASNSYVGVVVDKKEGERTERSKDDHTSDYVYTEYITFVKTDDGKKKKIIEHSGGTIVAYNYLPIGARFKFHPQFAFPYELYDKSSAPYIACAACGTHNDVSSDRCSRCNAPLLK